MEKVFVPMVCSDHTEKDEKGTDIQVKATYSGSLKIKLLSFPERCRLPQKLGIQDLQAESASEEDKKEMLKARMASLEFMAKAAEEIKPNILEVDLLELSTGSKITTIDELYCYDTTDKVIMELVSKFVFGFAEKK